VRVRRLGVLGTALIFSLSISIMPSASAATSAAPKNLVKAGTLTNCVDAEYPPLEYFSNGTSGKIIGFDADGAAALAKYWGLKIKQSNTAFDGLIPALAAKRCDIVWTGLYLSNKRLVVADGAVYLNTGPGLIVAAANPKYIKNVDSLCGLKVAAQGASANEGIIKAKSTACVAAGKAAIKLQSYPKVAETVAAVTNGQADALIETDVAVADIVKKSSGALKEIRKAFPTDTQFAVYVTKASKNIAALQKAIKALVANGTLKKIAITYGLDPGKVTAVARPAI
jgi:polar amino acid transport system substrate-binding protein